MNSENIIQLSGPFCIFDSTGQSWEIEAIRIFDEGYGIIDVYVSRLPADDEALSEGFVGNKANSPQDCVA